jgi:hypothetical protein
MPNAYYDGTDPDWHDDAGEILFAEMDLPFTPQIGMAIAVLNHHLSVSGVTWHAEEQFLQVSLDLRPYAETLEEFNAIAPKFKEAGWSESHPKDKEPT